jgi:hypothetical protein
MTTKGLKYSLESRKKSDFWLGSKQKKFPQPRGLNIEPVEKLLDKGKFSAPLGHALEKEYGKRISTHEWVKKGDLGGILGFEGVFGMVNNIRAVNRRLLKSIKHPELPSPK